MWLGSTPAGSVCRLSLRESTFAERKATLRRPPAHVTRETRNLNHAREGTVLGVPTNKIVSHRSRLYHVDLAPHFGPTRIPAGRTVGFCTGSRVRPPRAWTSASRAMTGCWGRAPGPSPPVRVCDFFPGWIESPWVIPPSA